MKNITECMAEINTKNVTRVQPKSNQGLEIVNKLFDDLKSVAPAMFASIKSTEELNSIKAQWVVGLKQNGINSTGMLKAGLMIARRKTNPFLPSIGQFCEWCKVGIAEQYGMLTADQLIVKYKKFCESKGFDDFHEFDYGSDANYWLLNDLYKADHEERINLKEKAQSLIIDLTQKIMNGYEVPKPTLLLPEKVKSKPLSREQGLQRLVEIKNKFRLCNATP